MASNLSSSVPASNKVVQSKNLASSLPSKIVEKKAVFAIDQQIEMLKNDIFKSFEAFKDPNTLLIAKILDNATMKQLLQTHMTDLPANNLLVKTIQKTRSTATILINTFKLFENSEVTPLLVSLILELNKKGFNKTSLFHQIVYNNLIQPLTSKSPNKKLHILFTDNTEVNPALTFSIKLKENYRLLSNILCPVTSEEFEPMVKRKITFEEVTLNLRLFLDMSKKLSEKFQDELFNFINNLQLLKSKEDFLKIVNSSAININALDREELTSAVKAAFEVEKVDSLKLKKTITNIISNNTKNLCLGMNWTYLECLQEQESKNE